MSNLSENEIVKMKKVISVIEKEPDSLNDERLNEWFQQWSKKEKLEEERNCGINPLLATAKSRSGSKRFWPDRSVLEDAEKPFTNDSDFEKSAKKQRFTEEKKVVGCDTDLSSIDNRDHSCSCDLAKQELPSEKDVLEKKSPTSGGTEGRDCNILVNSNSYRFAGAYPSMTASSALFQESERDITSGLKQHCYGNLSYRNRGDNKALAGILMSGNEVRINDHLRTLDFIVQTAVPTVLDKFRSSYQTKLGQNLLSNPETKTDLEDLELKHLYDIRTQHFYNFGAINRSTNIESWGCYSCRRESINDQLGIRRRGPRDEDQFTRDLKFDVLNNEENYGIVWEHQKNWNYTVRSLTDYAKLYFPSHMAKFKDIEETTDFSVIAKLIMFDGIFNERQAKAANQLRLLRNQINHTSKNKDSDETCRSEILNIVKEFFCSFYCTKEEHTSDNCSCIRVQEIMRTFENTRNDLGPAILLPLKSLIIPKNGSYKCILDLDWPPLLDSASKLELEYFNRIGKDILKIFDLLRMYGYLNSEGFGVQLDFLDPIDTQRFIALTEILSNNLLDVIAIEVIGHFQEIKPCNFSVSGVDIFKAIAESVSINSSFFIDLSPTSSKGLIDIEEILNQLPWPFAVEVRNRYKCPNIIEILETLQLDFTLVIRNPPSADSTTLKKLFKLCEENYERIRVILIHDSGIFRIVMEASLTQNKKLSEQSFYILRQLPFVRVQEKRQNEKDENF